VSTTTVPREQVGSNPFWVFFFGFGLLLVVYGIYAMTLPHYHRCWNYVHGCGQAIRRQH
jgi:hypothetical protein